MIHPRTKAGDQFQPLARFANQTCVDLIGNCGHQHISARHCSGQFFARHRAVIVAQFNVKQLFHPGFNRFGQTSRHDNT
jgi:hypothetical protein